MKLHRPATVAEFNPLQIWETRPLSCIPPSRTWASAIFFRAAAVTSAEKRSNPQLPPRSNFIHLQLMPEQRTKAPTLFRKTTPGQTSAWEPPPEPSSVQATESTDATRQRTATQPPEPPQQSQKPLHCDGDGDEGQNLQRPATATATMSNLGAPTLNRSTDL